jgi:hypothetical protein
MPSRKPWYLSTAVSCVDGPSKRLESTAGPLPRSRMRQPSAAWGKAGKARSPAFPVPSSGRRLRPRAGSRTGRSLLIHGRPPLRSVFAARLPSAAPLSGSRFRGNAHAPPGRAAGAGSSDRRALPGHRMRPRVDGDEPGPFQHVGGAYHRFAMMEGCRQQAVVRCLSMRVSTGARLWMSHTPMAGVWRGRGSAGRPDAPAGRHRGDHRPPCPIHGQRKAGGGAGGFILVVEDELGIWRGWRGLRR